MSPTVLRAGGYRFFFYSREPAGAGLEPPHIHVVKGGSEAKVWVDSAEVEHSWGFSPQELRAIRKIVAAERDLLSKAWHEHVRDTPGQDGGSR
ncbi:MAG: DUF4160 domain-containing protein [Longimicrobiales bacterium]